MKAARNANNDAVRNAVGRAIRSGQLSVMPCEVCGKVRTAKRRREIVAHHPDYNYPLAVMWLCSKHHLEWHDIFVACALRDEHFGKSEYDFYKLGLAQKAEYGNGLMSHALTGVRRREWSVDDFMKRVHWTQRKKLGYEVNVQPPELTA
jgi:hypothetical protein